MRRIEHVHKAEHLFEVDPVGGGRSAWPTLLRSSLLYRQVLRLNEPRRCIAPYVLESTQYNRLISDLKFEPVDVEFSFKQFLFE